MPASRSAPISPNSPNWVTSPTGQAKNWLGTVRASTTRKPTNTYARNTGLLGNFRKSKRKFNQTIWKVCQNTFNMIFQARIYTDKQSVPKLWLFVSRILFWHTSFFDHFDQPNSNSGRIIRNLYECITLLTPYLCNIRQNWKQKGIRSLFISQD